MEPSDRKAVIEAFNVHGVCIVPCIWQVQRRFHLETKDLQNNCFCFNLTLDKPEHPELVGQYKQRPVDFIDTANVCDNYYKDINEELRYFQIVPKRMENQFLKESR